MRLNVNPDRWRRHQPNPWTVRVRGAVVYQGTQSGEAFRILNAEESDGNPDVVILRYGRRIWPPQDVLPFVHGGEHL